MRFLPVWAVGLLVAVGALAAVQQGVPGVLAATVAVLLVIAVAVDLVPAPSRVATSQALQRQTTPGSAVRQRDPDSAGRPRPRAPSAA